MTAPTPLLQQLQRDPERSAGADPLIGCAGQLRDLEAQARTATRTSEGAVAAWVERFNAPPLAAFGFTDPRAIPLSGATAADVVLSVPLRRWQAYAPVRRAPLAVRLALVGFRLAALLVVALLVPGCAEQAEEVPATQLEVDALWDELGRTQERMVWLEAQLADARARLQRVEARP